MTTYHSICAFANDFEDLGGGYIIVGVDTDENGVAKRPVVGVPEEQIDDILQDMIGYNAKFGPYYMPRTSTEDVDGKKVLVIWCSTGVPTIQEKLKLNGSPRATFESGDDRLTFLITIPVHEGCEKKLMTTEGSGKTDEMSVETNKRSIRIRKIMKAEPTITLKGIAELLGVTSRTIERTVAQMIIDGDIVHEGPKKGGIWKVLK